MRGELSTVHRAIFGDVKGAHNLIVASAGAPDLAISDLAAYYTDRLLPVEVAWESYTCGFPVRDRYVLTRTFPVRATRSGMVQTHALLFEQQEIVQLSLRTLLGHLPRGPVVDPGADLLEALILEPSLESETAPPVLSGYGQVVRLLLAGAVPVWLDQDGFEEVVALLWRNLWADVRRNLRFRVSGDPQDLTDFPASIVWTPKALVGNWKDAVVVRPNGVVLQNPSLAEAYFLGIEEGRKFLALRDRLQFQPPVLTGLKRLEQYAMLSKGDTADSIRGAVRLLNALLPLPGQAPDEKRTLLDRLVQTTIGGAEDDVLGLRNMELTGFAESEQGVKRAIADWLRVQVARRGGGARVAKEILLASNPWTTTANAALMDVFESWSDEHAALLWDWWEEEPRLIPASLPLATRHSAGAEGSLVRMMPAQLRSEIFEPALEWSKSLKCLSLHAKLLARSPALSISDKFRRQIEVDAELGARGGVEALAGFVTDREMFAAALELNDNLLSKLAGDAAARTPTLMANLDPAMPGWRKVWLSRILSGGHLFDGVAQPSAIAHILFDAVTGGATIAPELLYHVARSVEADLCGYRRRQDLWQHLPDSASREILEITAREWLERFFRDPEFDRSATEPALRDRVLNDWRREPGRASWTNVSCLLDRFEAQLSEQDMLAWLSNYPSRLTTIESRAFGEIVAKKGWSATARELYRLGHRGRHDLHAALHECSELLGFWDRCSISLWTTRPVITGDQWWDAWLELSHGLYPKGVDENDIWRRADGDLSRINDGPGRDQWGHGLRLLRNGGAGGSMTIEGLLHQMRRDYFANSQLELLERIYLELIRY